MTKILVDAVPPLLARRGSTAKYVPRNLKVAVLHAVSLVHWAIIRSRSWCADSPVARVRLAGKLEQAQTELALLKEELRIKDARMSGIPARNRPFYPPIERMAILELKAARGWNLVQTAKTFLVEPETIASWLQRLDEAGDGLVQISPPPVNKFPHFVGYVVRRLKTLCPRMGKRRIAETLARAGLSLAAATVGRILRAKPSPPVAPEPAHAVSEKNNRTVTARYPNHVWHVDLTVVPTTAGFWVPWFPHALPQVWPFAYWTAVVVDHFSRRVMGFAVFKKQPSSLDVRSFLGRVMSQGKVLPRHLISDRGSQFDCRAFRKWAKRKTIKLRYGAIGKYGSIAVIERLMLSLKSEFTNHVLIPFNMDEFRHEVGWYATWYNEYRPHQALGGKTPQDVYSGAPQVPPCPMPNSTLPVMELAVSHLHENRLLPIVRLGKAS